MISVINLCFVGVLLLISFTFDSEIDCLYSWDSFISLQQGTKWFIDAIFAIYCTITLDNESFTWLKMKSLWDGISFCIAEASIILPWFVLFIFFLLSSFFYGHSHSCTHYQLCRPHAHLQVLYIFTFELEAEILCVFFELETYSLSESVQNVVLLSLQLGEDQVKLPVRLEELRQRNWLMLMMDSFWVRIM